MRHSKHSASSRPEGFTLIELLIAVIIIGILATIVIGVYVNRANDARLTAAISDLEMLQQGEQHAGIDTGYFYRLYVLDDVPYGDNIVPSDVAGSTDRVDGIEDERLRVDVANPMNIFIETTPSSSNYGQMLTNGQQIFTRLMANETTFNWKGPYVNFSRKIGPKIPAAKDGTGTPLIGQYPGVPLDPWGNAYLLFTKEGFVSDQLGSVVSSVTIDGVTYDAKVFDRPTVLSLGPNGQPGSAGVAIFGQGDDLYRQF